MLNNYLLTCGWEDVGKFILIGVAVGATDNTGRLLETVAVGVNDVCRRTVNISREILNAKTTAN